MSNELLEALSSDQELLDLLVLDVHTEPVAETVAESVVEKTATVPQQNTQGSTARNDEHLEVLDFIF